MCQAAIHSGIIKPTEPKTILVEKMPGQTSYKESTRNGIISKPSGTASGSFRVSVPIERPVEPTPEPFKLPPGDPLSLLLF